MTCFDWAVHAAAIAPAAAVLLLIVSAAEAGQPAQGLDPGRVREVAAMLPERPAGTGRPIGDREAWDRLAGNPAVKAAVAKAEELLRQPIPDQPDDLYLEFSRNGNRSRFEKVAFSRRGRLAPLVLAECAENKGRFLKAIEQLVDALAAERTWVLPAHDRSLANFHGKTTDIDLFSSAVGWNLATADWLLGDRLSASARRKLRENVVRRVIAPYQEMIAGTRERNGWITVTNNWNAVCLAGVTGAALALVESREDRAAVVVAAEKYSRHFLEGFTPDGYCSEGLGYWNYGFGHYVMLAETVRQATGGVIDLMARPEVRAPAAFGARIGIVGGVSPAFADCSLGTRPAPTIMYFVNRRFGLGLDQYNSLDLATCLSSLAEATAYAFPNAATFAQPAPGRPVPVRDWFADAGVLVCRPHAGQAGRFGAALKGGHNAEHHNHNDVGSYVVVVGDRPVLLDPGRETYTARTFSARRYDSKLLNSYGHPVPVVAGRLQQTGRQSRAAVLQTDFTDAADTLQLDLRPAYDVPELKSLVRTFVFSRKGAGSLTVTDRVELATPQTFATALVTLDRWRRQGQAALIVGDGPSSVRIDIDAGGEAFALQEEQIIEDAPVRPTRIGINLSRPVTSATVTVRITPVEGQAE